MKPFQCKKCKKPQKYLCTMGEFMGYNKYFNDDDWFCEECFLKKLTKVNKEKSRAGEQTYDDYKGWSGIPSVYCLCEE